jgi:hypothetical protein
MEEQELSLDRGTYPILCWQFFDFLVGFSCSNHRRHSFNP